MIGALRWLRLRRAGAAADDEALGAGQPGRQLDLDGLGEDADVTIGPHLRAASLGGEEDALVGLGGVEFQP